MAYTGPFGALTQDAANALLSAGTSALASLFRNVYYLDPANGYDGNTGGSPAQAFKTLAAAYGACVAGQNDAVALMANGGTSGTARVDASFTWAKSETHLIGLCSPVQISQRARIAPTSTTTAFTPYFTVSASGCIFQNIQFFMGFTTGTTAQIGMVVTGSRNYFVNCQIAGMADNESAQSATSRSLKIGAAGSGENVFELCTIGVDTITRTQANASVEFAGATARNIFRKCLFPFQTSAAGVLGILGTGNECMDRWQSFDNCSFINNIKSTSTAMTVLGSMTTASPGGLMLFKQCVLVGIGEYGDTNSIAVSYIDGFTGLAASSGIAVNPS